MKKRVIVLLFSVVTVLYHLAADANAETHMSRGEALYNRHCSRCHGEKAAGTDKGPPLVHRIYHPSHHSNISFHMAVTRGVKAHHWNFGDMPKIKGLDMEKTRLIIYYLRRLQKDAGIF